MLSSEEEGFNEDVTITLNSVELASVILAVCSVIEQIESGQRDYGQVDQGRTRVLKSVLRKITEQAGLRNDR